MTSSRKYLMSKKFKTILKGIILGLSLGVVIATAIIGVKFELHGKLPPNTVIADIELGYASPGDAVKALKEKEKDFLQTPLEFAIKINGELRTAEILPQDIDTEYSIIETVSTIDRIDLRQSTLPQVLHRAGVEGSAEVLYTFSADKLKKLLDEKIRLSEIAPKNSTYFINENSKLDITEEKAGKLISYEEAIGKTKTALAYMRPLEATLQTRDVEPSIKKEELELLKDEVVQKLKHKVLITHGNNTWSFTPIHHLDWVEFTETSAVTLPYLGVEIELDKKYMPEQLGDREKKIKIVISEEKLDEYIDAEMSGEIEVEIDPVSIYKDENSDIVIDGKGTDGVAIQRGALRKSLELAVDHQIGLISVHTKTILSPVTISAELQEMGIKELLGVGHTSFYGSPSNRIHNIQTGVDRFSGILIPPGEEFSFNTNLGRVDATTGYKKELVIKKEGTIPEYGGGLCQVSTTAYRAAMFSGLPITSRAPHSYAVSYYSQILGYGLDATIYLGGQDLKFLNDTDSYMLIHSYVSGSHAYFKFYGTSDGRQTSFDGPYFSRYKYPSQEAIYVTSHDLAPGETKQVERRNVGFDAIWYRTITRLDGMAETEEVFSRYKATQEKYWVNPGP
jgi:vancomycin resistance protein YoaR